MRNLDAAEIAAIQARTVIARDFLWVTVKDRSTGIAYDYGFWNEVSNVNADVLDGRSGATVTRTFIGVGNALSVGSIPLTSDVTIRNVDITLPHLDDTVQVMIRGYDPRGAPMQVYRGYFDAATRLLVASAKPRFVGYVDGTPIVTPAENGEGSVTLKCVSTTRELTRTSSEVRSNQSQFTRSPTDTFYQDVGVVGDWDIAWGVNRSTPAKQAAAVPLPPFGG